MATPDCYVGDIGFQLFVQTGVDVTPASAVSIRYTKPDGTTGSWTGTATSIDFGDGPKNGVQRITESGDLDQAGTWRLDVLVSGLAGFTGTAGGNPPPTTLLVGRPQT